MLLRSITKHVKDQNWFAVALDFFIVIVGILIAFQITNWNEGRQEKERELEYINRIQEDLIATKEDMKTRVDYFAGIRLHALAALEGHNETASALDQQFLIDSFIASFALVRPLQSNTFDELLSAGAMNSISNVQIRRRITEYYRVAEGTEQIMNDVPDYGDQLSRVMPYEVLNALRTGDCNARFSANATGAIAATLPENCTPNISVEVTEVAAKKILERNLEPELLSALADFDLKIRLFELFQERAQNLHDFLEETK